MDSTVQYCQAYIMPGIWPLHDCRLATASWRRGSGDWRFSTEPLRPTRIRRPLNLHAHTASRASPLPRPAPSIAYSGSSDKLDGRSVNRLPLRRQQPMPLSPQLRQPRSLSESR